MNDKNVNCALCDTFCIYSVLLWIDIFMHLLQMMMLYKIFCVMCSNSCSYCV